MPFQISKKGYDILYQNDPRFMVFNSEANHLKTAISGTVRRTIPANNEDIFTIAHNLNITPLLMCYHQEVGTLNLLIASAYISSMNFIPGVDTDVEVRTTANQLFFRARNFANTQKVVDIFYEVFYEGME